MARTYIEMLNNALELQRDFNRALLLALAVPGNETAKREKERTSARLTGYCNAMADMFGKERDEVYRDVHDFTEAVVARERATA